MKKIIYLVTLFIIVGCEKPIFITDETDDAVVSGVTLSFNATTDDATRSTVVIGNYFTKLNVMLFDESGNKVFDKVKTQTIDDADFGNLKISLKEGTYTVVAVGHSSIRSATIKSPQMVQFTASDGEKLTDTFCCCTKVTIGEEAEQFSLTMQRVSAMFRVVITDESISTLVAKMKFDYKGGSANFNPTTFEGTTKSTQSEIRLAGGNTYECYTFLYLSSSGTLTVTLSALAADGTIICQRTFDNVPVVRNRITTYTGHFFEEGSGDITQSGFGFMVDADWDGIDEYTF